MGKQGKSTSHTIDAQLVSSILLAPRLNNWATLGVSQKGNKSTFDANSFSGFNEFYTHVRRSNQNTVYPYQSIQDNPFDWDF